MEKNKIKKSAAVFATTLIIIIVGVASFAYFGTFDVNLINNVAVNINAVSPGNASFVSSGAQLNLQVPAANMSQTNAGSVAAENNAVLTVNLTGAKDLLTTCTYDIVYEYDENSNVYGYGETPVTENGNSGHDITLSIFDDTSSIEEPSTNGITYYYNGRPFNYFEGSDPYKIFDENDKWDSIRKRVLVRNASIISTGELVTQKWFVDMAYLNLPISQEQLAGKAFTGKIYVENYDCETIEFAYMTILANNKVNETTPNFTSTATTNEGMYTAKDDFGTSYYFRGAVNNNWVQFGKDSSGNEMYWRIIRINGDGSIRMIYSGTTKPESNTAMVMTGTGTQITVDSTNTFEFNSSYNKAEYVGYMYTEGEQHGNSTSSGVKKIIENWFAGTTLKDNALVSKDQIFCNDRSTSLDQTSDWTSRGVTYYYGAFGRLIESTKSPQLTCPEESDKFTTKDSKIGNKALEYPVGLITADEVAMAGGVCSTENTSYYLYTNQYYWSGSPSHFLSSSVFADEFAVHSSGVLDYKLVDNTYGVRPVISLSPKVKLSGSGTYDDVYTVS